VRPCGRIGSMLHMYIFFFESLKHFVSKCSGSLGHVLYGLEF
jgi:hypothetical protein